MNKSNPYIPHIPVTEKTLITVAEAAGITGLTDRQIYGMINNAGEQPSWTIRIGERTMVKREKFIEYLNNTKELKRY